MPKDLNVAVIPKEVLADMDFTISFFGYDNDKDLKVCFLVMCIMVCFSMMGLIWNFIKWRLSLPTAADSCLRCNFFKHQSDEK